MRSPASRPVSLAGLLFLPGGCAVGRSDVDPAAPRRYRTDGTGAVEGIGWRLSVYPSREGPCLEMEITAREGGVSGGGSCGQIDAAPGDPFTRVGAGTAGGGPQRHIEGLARLDVSEIWLETANGRRLPASLFDLDEVDIPARPYLVFVPGSAEPRTLVALNGAGNELGRADVSDLFR